MQALLALALAVRADLMSAGANVCGESEKTLAQAGVFDAQVEVEFVRNVNDLKKLAADFAKDNGHRGYAYGHCRGKRQWVLSVPAPAPVIEGDRFKVTLHGAALAAHCKAYDLDATTVKSNQPKSLVKKKAPVKQDETINFMQGEALTTLAVTCYPKDSKTKGPELWALVPADRDERVYPKMTNEVEFLAWIQSVRKETGLKELATDNAAVRDVAAGAAKQTDLHHPHDYLMDQKAKLKSSGITLLGEDRASAEDYEALARLLWNSPKHRGLLLNPEANAIGISVTPRDEEQLLVLVLAKAEK